MMTFLQIVGTKLPRCIARRFSRCRRAGPSRLMYTRRHIRPHNLPVPESHRSGGRAVVVVVGIGWE
jgi:hypothetical protein